MGFFYDEVVSGSAGHAFSLKIMEYLAEYLLFLRSTRLEQSRYLSRK